MGFSKQWLIAICTVSVISAVIEAAIPNSKSKKAYSFLAAAVIIYVLLLPLINGSLSEFDISDILSQKGSVSVEYEDNSSQTMLRAVKEGYEILIEEKISEKNITTDKVSVICKETSDGYEVEKVVLYGALTDTEKIICRNEIKKLCKKMPETVFSEGEKSGG